MGKIQVILIVYGFTERGGFGIYGVSVPTDVGGAQDSESFGIGRHDSVFDPIVDHFDEMTRPIRSTVQITKLSRAVELFPAGRAINLTSPGCESFKDWIEMFNHCGFTANHHAVTAFQAPNPAARAHITVLHLLTRQFFAPPDIVNVVGITAVDHNITRFK